MKMKNIYTILDKIQFEKRIDDFVALNEKGADLGMNKMYMQQFVFSIVQKFYEDVLEHSANTLVMPQLPDGLVEGSNCDDNFKAGWIACYEKIKGN